MGHLQIHLNGSLGEPYSAKTLLEGDSICSLVDEEYSRPARQSELAHRLAYISREYGICGVSNQEI